MVQGPNKPLCEGHVGGGRPQWHVRETHQWWTNSTLVTEGREPSNTMRWGPYGTKPKGSRGFRMTGMHNCRVKGRTVCSVPSSGPPPTERRVRNGNSTGVERLSRCSVSSVGVGARAPRVGYL